MEQLLPPELGANIADLQQQQQQQGDGDDDSLLEFGSGASGSELGSQLRSSGSVQLGERQRYREAAEKIRDTIAAGRQELRSKGGGGQGHLMRPRFGAPMRRCHEPAPQLHQHMHTTMVCKRSAMRRSLWCTRARSSVHGQGAPHALASTPHSHAPQPRLLPRRSEALMGRRYYKHSLPSHHCCC